MNCPQCKSTHINKYGHTHYGKPRFRCQSCGRQFVEAPTRQPIGEQTRSLIDKLLLERLALAAIARVAGVSERWRCTLIRNIIKPQSKLKWLKKKGQVHNAIR